MRAVPSTGDRILKVNHAGEHGAVCIYAGQIAVAGFTAPSLVPQLRDFMRHELRHRAVFQGELARRGVRRCRSYGLCAAGGYLLGIVTGMLGRSAIAATTVAVERVVLQHLQQQLRILEGQDAAACKAISSIVDDETRHHDESAHHLKAGDLWPKVIGPLVQASTESVIWLGMRL